jgi:hypothetical protein
MSDESRILAALLFIAVPTVQFGGLALLAFLTRRLPGYLDNPLRQAMYRAGHAHAGVWLVLAMVAMLYVDHADLPTAVAWVVRIAFALAPILMALGFFLSVLSPRAERPNGLIAFVYLGGLSLAVGVLALGIGLLQA